MSGLFILAGQSNALVFNLTPAQLPDYALTPDPHVQIWTPAGFQTMAPGVNTGTANNPTSWGPEVSFAHDWVAAHPGEMLYLVKSVRGSTGLIPGSAPNWSPHQPPAWDGTPNGMFNKTTVLVGAARAACGLPIDAVFWMQGEQDATDPAAAAAYQANLTDVFAHMRSEWGADRIVFGQISNRAGLAHDDQVRAAQLAVDLDDHRALLINTDALPVQADELHLAPAGALGLGDAFYAAHLISQVLASANAGLFGPIWAGLL